MVEFAVPAMFTESQVKYLDKLNKESKNGRRIKEVYGSIPGGPIGTIRPSKSLPQISLSELKEFVGGLKDVDIQFDYIMNSTVLDGLEYTNEGKKSIVEFVGELVECGIESITVSTPYIVRLIHKYYPELKITASICAEIESVQRAIDFQEIGVSRIVPAKDITRDFELLKKINNAFDGSIKLLATTPCLYKCSDLYYHMNVSSIQENKLKRAYGVQGDFVSHTTSRCQKRRLENLEEYIKSPWIRPEDVSYYEKLGIYEFKLDGRDRSETYNNEVIKAYMDGEYEGNLLYLMQYYYPKNSDEFEKIKRKEEGFWRLGVYMNNKKLDGFLDKFVNAPGACSSGCAKCNYCEMWAKKAIDYDEENRNSYLRLLSKKEEEALSFN